jgi:hypothetical protein
VLDDARPRENLRRQPQHHLEAHMIDIPAILAAATTEQQLGFRLEAIFMPEARRQRNAFYEANSNPRFVHYTRADAALDIIRKKRLWLRNTTAMVDYREVQHGFDLLAGWFNAKNKGNREKFIAVFDAIHPGAALEAITRFDEMWQRTDVGVRVHTYIGSVSVHDPSEDDHGRLSMWRAFGADAGARVALVFKVPVLSGAVQFLQCTFSPVAYLNEERAYKIIEEVLVNAKLESDFLRSLSYDQLRDWIYLAFALAATCVKHEGFKEEQEWRILYFPGLNPPSTPPVIESEIVSLGGVPQTIYKFPLDARVAPEVAALDVAAMFDRLIIGPARYPWGMYEAFTKTLEEAGVADAGSRVITSTIPIRS